MAEAGPGSEFVDGWLVAQVLGEGAYGEVRLLVHARSGAAVALKVTRAEEGGGAREAALHRALRHPHVLRCLGARAHPPLHYMFLEYAQGGELFDRIEPDVGMAEPSARRYWRQLAAGLRYLHQRGVAHRDIKPENLLLDARDQLKISDFGMATLFRHGSRERLLSRVCGTLPYCAPEVVSAARRPYRAPPADLWAAGLVLLAMLRGELPWERAAEAEPRFAAWAGWAGGCAQGGLPQGGPPQGAPPPPFHKLSPPALALLRRLLQPDPDRRPPLERLLQHRWLQHPDQPDHDECAARAWRSQPGAVSAAVVVGDSGGPAHLTAADMDALVSHSQPAAADDLLLPTQHTPEVSSLLVRRMTRVRVPLPPAAALRALAAAAASLGYTAHAHPPTVWLECSLSLRVRAWAAAAEGGALLELRRGRGCGLEFKRCFLRLRRRLLDDLGLPDHQPADRDC